MAQLTLSIYKKTYTINCDPAEHEKLRSLADQVNKKLTSIEEQQGPMSEVAMLSFALLSLMDDMTSLKNTKSTKPSTAYPEPSPSASLEDATPFFDVIQSEITRITKKIEAEL